MKIKCEDKQNTKSSKDYEGDYNHKILHDDLFNDLKNDYSSFKYTDESKGKITESQNKDEIQINLKELNDCLDEISASDAVLTLRNILIKVSEKSLDKIEFQKNKINPKRKKKFAPWMNTECKTLKTQLNAARKSIKNYLVVINQNT